MYAWRNNSVEIAPLCLSASKMIRIWEKQTVNKIRVSCLSKNFFLNAFLTDEYLKIYARITHELREETRRSPCHVSVIGV
jgi:hypothetical protein